MTDEERQKLRDDLLSGISTISWLLTSAAEALAQSDMEPVCLWRYKGEKLWHECNEAEYRILGDNLEDVERRLVYTAPPRPDASTREDYEASCGLGFKTSAHASDKMSNTSVGLIEAAEWHEEKAKKFQGIKTGSAALITQHHYLAATYFRARATDRSGNP